MDRNTNPGSTTLTFPGVALRKESVDRNMSFLSSPVAVGVALRKESVDRNVILLAVLLSSILSLSARRAWIEMTQCKL